jgi:D-alanyl-D-alanine carboxypeptidase/D-alanyl-D-alanine-endopeptidase (penicillin-binding protein 4)
MHDMKKCFWLACVLSNTCALHAQHLEERLSKAVEKLQQDAQLKHAILGISIVKTETGEKVFELNAQTGLAPASCQKTITSAAAMELLGQAYRYTTTIGYNGDIDNGTLKGNLILTGSGDPTFGSWRYDSTRNDQQLARLIGFAKNKGINRIDGGLIGYNNKWEAETIPGGWIWDDMGNYYGSGTTSLNWHENQYDLVLRSGSNLGDKVSIVETRPKLYEVNLQSQLTSAAKGTGDNASIYLSPYSSTGVVRGTIPVDEKAFIISGSFPDPAMQCMAMLETKLDSAGMKPQSFAVSARETPAFETLGTLYSPPLDSINYFFMKRSINFYGETLVKTIAFEKTGMGSTDKGIAIIKDFWKDKGIDPTALHMLDGSGLSPQNRVTVDALVKVLQYAKSRPWFNYYYDALPVYNQMKLKSGTIGGAKSFAGYHTAKDGTAYTVAIIVNNFDGSAGEVVKKMFLILDELK